MVLFPRILAAFLIALWVYAPAQGRSEEEREGGIIGTGIVGTITHLGSIHVNGLHIQVDDMMPISGSVEPIAAGDLEPGHTVAIVAERVDDGWHARHIRQVFPLVGQVTDFGDGELAVLGTRVTVGETLPDLLVGDWVAVSGLWQEQAVRASRIERLTGTEYQARISGTYLSSDQNGALVIGSSLISGISPQHLQSGDLVRVYGEPGPSGIEATRLETGLFDETVGIIQVQGYYSAPQPDGLYTVLGSGLVAYTNQPLMIDTEISVIQCGRRGRLSTALVSELIQTEQDVHLSTELDC